jgi:hypothetical protein
MRAQLRLSSTAAVLTGLLALTTALPAQAQGTPAGKAPAKPAAAPAKPAAAPAKPAAAPAKPAAAAGPKVVARPTAAKAPVAAKAPAAPKPLTDKQKKDLAKKNYKDGEALFKDAKYAEALEHYKVAEDAVPIGATKLKIAICLDKLGKVQESVAAYQIYLESKPDAVKAKDQIADSTTRIEALKKTPGKVRIATDPSSPPNLKFAIDGAAPVAGVAVAAPVAPPPPPPAAPVAPTAAGAAPAPAGAGVAAPTTAVAPPAPMAFNGEFAMAPGRHKITATADGYDPTAAELEVSFAETKDLKLVLNATPPPPPPPPPVAVEPPKPPPPPPRSNVPAYVTLGLAGAGAIVGTIFGISALGAKSDFKTNPTTDNADKTDRNALIADMSFAVALTFGVTGAVLLLSNDTPTETKAATNGAPRKPVKTAMPRGFVAPYAGPTGAGAAAFMTF